MPYGFRGNACKTYLEAVDKALTAAETAHMKYPFEGLPHNAELMPALPPRDNNEEPPFPVGDAMSGGNTSGVGSSSNVVVDKGKYDSLLQDMKSADQDAIGVINNVLQQLRNLCGTAYNLPDTTPRFEGVLDEIMNTFGQYHSLTSTIEGATRDFASEVESIG